MRIIPPDVSTERKRVLRSELSAYLVRLVRLFWFHFPSYKTNGATVSNI
jgi:hypothetical protein